MESFSVFEENPAAGSDEELGGGLILIITITPATETLIGIGWLCSIFLVNSTRYLKFLSSMFVSACLQMVQT